MCFEHRARPRAQFTRATVVGNLYKGVNVGARFFLSEFAKMPTNYLCPWGI
jgi:hypothetical protein